MNAWPVRTTGLCPTIHHATDAPRAWCSPRCTPCRQRGVLLTDCSPKCSPQRYVGAIRCKNSGMTWEDLSFGCNLTPCVPGNGGPK
jgi:hypothetical protein